MLDRRRLRDQFVAPRRSASRQAPHGLAVELLMACGAGVLLLVILIFGGP